MYVMDNIEGIILDGLAQWFSADDDDNMRGSRELYMITYVVVAPFLLTPFL